MTELKVSERLSLPKEAALARFWSKVEKKAEGDCWVWRESTDRYGYGSFRFGARKVQSHVFAYEAVKGAVPDGLSLDHLCRNTRCVNPDHLEAVSTRVNILRGEGLAAKNARKTACIHGHPLSGENLIIDKLGARRCRQCARIRGRKYDAKRRRSRNHP